MNGPLNILIGRVCSDLACDVDDAVSSGCRSDARIAVETAYAALRDDLGQYPAPDWLRHVFSPAALVHAVCMRIAGEMRHQVDGRGGSDHVLHEAAVRAVACICLAMDDDEEVRLERTLAVMRHHAEAAREAALRTAAYPPLAALSPGLRRAILTCILDHLGEWAFVLTERTRPRTAALAATVLATCAPSLVHERDLVALALDGRRDRRGIDLAGAILGLCLRTAAHALDSTAPDETGPMAFRMAADALGKDGTLEMRLRARLLAVGRMGDDGRRME